VGATFQGHQSAQRKGCDKVDIDIQQRHESGAASATKGTTA